MTDDTAAAFLAEHPEMAGVLFTTMLLQFRTGAAAPRSLAYAGP